MRIIFMGTPEFAVPCLERLIQDGHEVSGVFTQPDKPKGRGYSVMPPPVKQAALKAGIPVYQPASVKTEAAFAQLKALDPELIVVVAYGKFCLRRCWISPIWVHQCACIVVAAAARRGADPVVDPAGRSENRRDNHVYGRWSGYGRHAPEGGNGNW